MMSIVHFDSHSDFHHFVYPQVENHSFDYFNKICRPQSAIFSALWTTSNLTDFQYRNFHEKSYDCN